MSTLEAFKSLLRAAPSIFCIGPKSGGVFGQYFAGRVSAAASRARR
jgi:hypothetical protein